MRPQVPEGYKVEFEHRREWDDSIHGDSSKGGTTVAIVYNEAKEEVVRAEARCSKHDNYNKRIGRDIALGRALKTLELTKDGGPLDGAFH